MCGYLLRSIIKDLIPRLLILGDDGISGGVDVLDLRSSGHCFWKVVLIGLVGSSHEMIVTQAWVCLLLQMSLSEYIGAPAAVIWHSHQNPNECFLHSINPPESYPGLLTSEIVS